MADKDDNEARDLKGTYGAIQSGIWLIGLAILAWQGWGRQALSLSSR